MPTYLVRMKKDNELVGIFSAEAPESLAELVDESVSPVHCEYLELPEGGIYVGGGAQPVPRDIEEDEQVEFFAGAVFTESWSAVIFGTKSHDEAADRHWRGVPHTPTSVMAANLGLD